MASAHDGFPVAMLPGNYQPQSGTTLAVDQNLPWLQNGMPISGGRNDPAAIVVDGPPRNVGRRNNGGGIGGFFRGLFGG